MLSFDKPVRVVLPILSFAMNLQTPLWNNNRAVPGIIKHFTPAFWRNSGINTNLFQPFATL